MIEILDFNIRGRKDLTNQCFATMRDTIPSWANVWVIILDAAFENEEHITEEDMQRWVPSTAYRWTLLPGSGFLMSLGWNTSIGYARKTVIEEGNDPRDYQLWQMNNDLIFKKPGWLEWLSNTLQMPGVGEAASSAGIAFGHSFVTGAVAGFNLGTIFDVIPSGEIMDLDLNYAYGDVVLSILIARYGLRLQRVVGLEWGDDPYIVHLISQTVYGREGFDNVMRYRAAEGRKFVEKFGRLDGKPLYEGI